jgi:hypothetical protein
LFLTAASPQKKPPGWGAILLVFSQRIILFVQSHIKKEPAIEIAGLCLPLKPQKERYLNAFNQFLFHLY